MITSPGEHGHDVGAAPGPAVSGSVEHVIEHDGVVRPAPGHGARVLVEAGQQRHVPGPGLGGHPGVGEAEHAWRESSHSAQMLDSGSPDLAAVCLVKGAASGW